MILVNRLTIADYISLLGIITIWLAIVAIFQEHPFIAINISLISFGIDMADGYVARKTKSSSKFGLQLDTIIDTLNYPIFTALFSYRFLFNQSIIGSVVAITILLFSSLRLSRMAIDGIKQTDGRNYYEGVITPHILATVIILFYVNYFFYPLNNMIQAILLIVLSCLMISTIKTYKPKSSVSAVGFALVLWIISFSQLLHV